MASNFDFLQNRYPNLYEHASRAESLIYSAPRDRIGFSRNISPASSTEREID